MTLELLEHHINNSHQQEFVWKELARKLRTFWLFFYFNFMCFCVIFIKVHFFSYFYVDLFDFFLNKNFLSISFTTFFLCAFLHLLCDFLHLLCDFQLFPETHMHFFLRKNDEKLVKFAFKYFKISHQGEIKIH
jgi:hypothetical protein